MLGRGASGDDSTKGTSSGRKQARSDPSQGRESERPRGFTGSSPGVYLKSTDMVKGC